MEGDPLFRFFVRSRKVISIHSLRMEGDYFNCERKGAIKYFNPLPPHGGRPVDYLLGRVENEFQSTPSAWRETEKEIIKTLGENYFNPLPPHGGRPVHLVHFLF